ncbi:MAG: ABC transporter ATP-binding protein [Acidimicrobiia bacterium]|nr:ABC transporter ATP-binding protein [Acidimicrobiia bacterium]
MTLDSALRLRIGTLDLDVSLSAEPGGLVVIVGPNGAGKTTALRCLAGLQPLESGHIRADGNTLDDPAARIFVAPEHRPIGVVFQEGRLFPHLDAADNVAFGLRCRGVARAEARSRAEGWLERIGLGGLGSSRPAALSGGQAQRVALARALAVGPRLLLLDEPLAALDATSRVEVRRELRDSLADFDGVRVLVTHDPVEALALADRIVVVEDGQVVQEGTPDDIRTRPRTRYVADLVGLNLLRGRGAGDRVVLDAGGELAAPGAGSGDVIAIVHPHAIALHRSNPDVSARNVWATTVESLDLEGDRVRVRLTGPVDLVAEVTPGAVTDLALAPGLEVWASVKATEVQVSPA